MEVPNDYQLFLRFIEKFSPDGFKGIKQEDPLVQHIHALMKRNKQHFHVADMAELKILYVSNTIEYDLGIQPEEYTPASELELAHPDDYDRFIAVRSKFIELCSILYHQQDEFSIMTTNIKFKHANGSYINFLLQGCAFSVSKPRPAAYGLVIKTKIDWFGPIKHGYNYYLGKDFSYFRLPDKDLIETGCIFTDREFEILKLLKDGLSSIQIGQKLFISAHTVDTHRRNILKKTDKTNTSELIIDLQEKGFF